MVKIPVIFEDEYLMVVDKPPGLVVDESSTNKGPTLVSWLKERYDTLEYHSGIKLERMGIVHRLDKDTSGLLLVAKTQTALEGLQSQFKERIVRKEYLALVHGFVEKNGVIVGAIERNPARREKFEVSTDGKEAETEYEPAGNFQSCLSADRFSILNFQSIFNDLNKIQTRKLERMHYNEFSLLKCHPKTGRTHQIRVHLKYIGHPVVSDEKYGGRKIVRLDKRWCPRQFLHAGEIGFKHPVNGIWIEFKSDLPHDLQEALGKLHIINS
ncbi:RluA family pseudouridine synthase [Candidatus Daviesbacteria bacterium]|nr:RluA family pseudouridine synthase [Candidatus Daviesbacteria bacterium]